jgi:hypothetical protein
MKFKHKCRHTKTIIGLNSQKISIKHGVDVIHYFSHLIRANECRNMYISKNPSVGLKQQGVPDGSDGSDGTWYISKM